MPKKRTSQSALPEREAAVCERLRSLRISERWKMESVAASVGLRKNQWASYEYGRAPVRYWLGRQVCILFGASQRWLATGELPMFGELLLSAETEAQFDKDALFTEVFDTKIKSLADQYYGFMADHLSTSPNLLDARRDELKSLNEFLLGSRAGRIVEGRLAGVIRKHLTMLPDELVLEYIGKVLDAANEFADAHTDRIKDHLRGRSAAVTQMVTGGDTQTVVDKPLAVSYPSSTDMKTRWKDYQKKLKELCKVRGVKAEIAKKLKVSRTMVSKWVAGSEPTADHAFALIEWIDAHWKAG